MRPICKLIFTFLLIPILSTVVMSQDVIIKKDGEKVKAKIVEINDTQIKYYEFRDINNLIFTLDRALIKEIKFESGTKYKEEQPGSSEVYYADDRINNLKINFFAIGVGDLVFSFERAIDAGSSWESSLKIFGLGFSEVYQGDRRGLGLNLGYKLKLGSIFKTSNSYRPKHILHGGYFRPVVGYSYNKSEYFQRIEKKSYASFGIDLGIQWILRNTVSLDLYLGFHYYGGSFTAGDQNSDVIGIYNDIEDGDLIGSDNRALAFGIRVGGLFSKKGIKNKKSR